MPLLKNNVLVPDTWIGAEAEGDLPPTGDIIVSFARLLKEWGELSQRSGKLGLRLSNTDRPEALATFLPRLSLIVLPFPAFNDGRAYSIARSLREMGYRGELRATGNVLPDQLQFMLQVGFDAFEIAAERVEDALALLKPFSAPYQAAANESPLFVRRAA